MWVRSWTMGSPSTAIRAVLFDWGGTLMREIPGFDGPMADWPRVEAIPGAREALEALHGRFAIAVATNAAASDGALVRAALARVGLDGYVDAAFTARELGVAKPDPEFFRRVLGALGREPSEVVMVGDSYGSDVVGAKGAGLRALWFNPTGARPPLVHPVHDAEVRILAELPRVLEGPFLPDLAEALALLRAHGVTENVVRHSLAVAAVAHGLALRLRERGVPVDPLLVHRGALLHDLDKLSSERPADHGVKAGDVLRRLGWPALARVAERHVLGAQPEAWEEKLVHYADKIVEEDEVVGLEARVTCLSCRYSTEGNKIARALPGLLALEEEILGALGVGRGELLAELGGLDPALPPFVSAPGAS